MKNRGHGRVLEGKAIERERCDGREKQGKPAGSTINRKERSEGK